MHGFKNFISKNMNQNQNIKKKKILGDVQDLLSEMTCSKIHTLVDGQLWLTIVQNIENNQEFSMAKKYDCVKIYIFGALYV